MLEVLLKKLVLYLPSQLMLRISDIALQRTFDTMRKRVLPTIFGTDRWETIIAKADHSGQNYGVFVGDALSTLQSWPSDCVNTCVTSPPYWSVRDYGREGQIGLEDDLQAYIKALVTVLSEVKRILTPEGTVWLNLGDIYLNQTRANSPSWQKNKQLALLPFRVAIALQEDGWLIRNSMVWHKPNAMPSSVRDRLTNTWEPVFLLTKEEQYYFNLDEIRVPHKTDDGIEKERALAGEAQGKAQGQNELRQWLNSPRHRATIDGLKEVRRRPNAPVAVELAAYLQAAAKAKGVSVKWVAEQLSQPFERVRHYFRTDVIGSRVPPEETWEQLKDLLDLGTEFDEAMEVAVGDNIFRNHPNGRNPGDMQSFSLKAASSIHFAVMPEELANWCVKATLPPEGICLDPFMGSGTTGRVALKNGGRFLGIELRDDYAEEGAKTLAEPTHVKKRKPAKSKKKPVEGPLFDQPNLH
ncbi:site-specific DNA-methyltransferase [Hymenobacter sediminis]|uniref:DNA-methyltransferase n=1 Tax=Hymenobacter sediminis TaxID=2218621 RepID=UPI000F4E1491|nr:site-specific DNA-methyltransferase [Hymenobacter sediminis]RPD44874.1 site-specific DNA-methyltransferase [Hymenobacter sediminis]